ncbi:synaptonemal complex protein 3 [Plakobranchus ocellatus]|uniref:Synaptonemal complex protein 3 n=1 Tax=Plakobranchus ocellatus TaxID=259542 RepID=A0AAV3ZW63_9GAST|nr:synaptonemal complex protein 3 [Plakobranchus ocellatus]
MPRAKKSGFGSDSNKGLKNGAGVDLDEDEMNGERSASSSPRNQDVMQHSSSSPAVTVSSGKKRQAADVDYDPSDFSHEMQKMLDGFGADISKTLSHKKKRMEQLTQSSLKSTNKKVEEIWRNQQQARGKLQDEFSKQINAVYQQWESDMEKSREQEEKLNTLFKQQQKLFQQSRIVQSQRLKTVRELSEQFVRGLEELDKTRESQHAALQSELKKEMQLLQKRILMDTQQQEMANVRKSLHQMLF